MGRGDNMILYPHFKKIRWGSERQFAELMESHGCTLIYQPRIRIPGLRRNFNDGTFLAPDFFCFETGYYYEVVNSSGNFNWRKPDIFAAILLDVPIKIVTPSGKPYLFRCYENDLTMTIERLGEKHSELFPDKPATERSLLMRGKIAEVLGLPMWYLWVPEEQRRVGGLTKEQKRFRRYDKELISDWLRNHGNYPSEISVSTYQQTAIKSKKKLTLILMGFNPL